VPCTVAIESVVKQEELTEGKYKRRHMNSEFQVVPWQRNFSKAENAEYESLKARG
jgi:hypothetical protein